MISSTIEQGKLDDSFILKKRIFWHVSLHRKQQFLSVNLVCFCLCTLFQMIDELIQKVAETCFCKWWLWNTNLFKHGKKTNHCSICWGNHCSCRATIQVRSCCSKDMAFHNHSSQMVFERHGFCFPFVKRGEILFLTSVWLVKRLTLLVETSERHHMFSCISSFFHSVPSHSTHETLLALTRKDSRHHTCFLQLHHMAQWEKKRVRVDMMHEILENLIVLTIKDEKNQSGVSITSFKALTD